MPKKTNERKAVKAWAFKDENGIHPEHIYLDRKRALIAHHWFNDCKIVRVLITEITK